MRDIAGISLTYKNASSCFERRPESGLDVFNMPAEVRPGPEYVLLVLEEVAEATFVIRAPACEIEKETAIAFWWQYTDSAV